MCFLVGFCALRDGAQQEKDYINVEPPAYREPSYSPEDLITQQESDALFTEDRKKAAREKFLNKFGGIAVPSHDE